MDFKMDTKGNLNITLPNTARTKAQQHVVNQMVKNNDISKLIKYLESFKAKRRSYVDMDRTKADGIDALSMKRPNTIAKLFEKLTRLDINHAPHSAKTTWCGVEIECCIPFSGVGQDTDDVECGRCDGSGTDGECTCETDEQRENCECEITCGRCEGEGTIMRESDSYEARRSLEALFKQNRVTLTSVKTDGSIQAPEGYFGIEITVLTKSDDSRNLEKVCGLLNQVGAKVNKSCGLHVHLDARHLDDHGAKRMGKRLGFALPVLGQMLPKSRLNNSYCKMAVSALRGGRYFAVNLTAFSKYKTVEVRCHSSTTDYKKITNWIEILRAVAYADGLTRTVKTINDLTDVVGIREDIVEYMTQRTLYFNPAPRANNDVELLRSLGLHPYADQDSTDVTSEPQNEAVGF